MKTVVLGPRPAELDALIERRRALGIDLFDEVWEGDYHVVPGPHSWHGYVQGALILFLAPYAETAGLVVTTLFNLGEPGDFRVPDGGYHRTMPDGVWVPTAAVVVEVVSPDDETYAKFGFYARHGVDELLVAEPDERRVRFFRRRGEDYAEAEASALLGVTAAAITAGIAWP